MEPGSIYLFLLLVVLISLSACFSASETALMSLSRIRLLNMVEENVKNADKIVKLVEEPQRLLSAILVGNNFVNISASSIATAIAISVAPKNGVGFATIIMTVVLLIFGEITPKTMASQNAEKVALRMVGFVKAVVIIFTPLVKILDFATNSLIRIFGGNNEDKTPTITEAELKTMVNVSHEEGVLEVDEHEMLTNVFEFGDSKARDVMTPRTDIVAVSTNAAFEEVIKSFKEEQFSKIPVYKEDIDDIVGLIYLKDMFFANKDDFKVENYMREAFFTYESKEISKLLKEMRTNGKTLAIVLDEYGGTSGLVTVEDMVEEIVGEIIDEYDMEEEGIFIVNENEYIVDGTTRIDDLNEILGSQLHSDSVETISGYIIGILGRFAQEGEVVETDGFTFTVVAIDKNRIDKLNVKAWE